MIGGRIACLGVPHEDTRRAIEGETPEGFSVEFVDELPPSRAEAAIAAADYLLVWSTRLPAETIRRATRARLIQKIGEGTDKIDVAAALAAGVPVAKTASVNAESCAELAVLLMLAVMRRLPEAHEATAGGLWRKWEVRAGTQELRGRRVGLLGLGKIGSIVGRIVSAFGAEVVYHRPSGPSSDVDPAWRYVDRAELFAGSDVISLHVPLNERTRGIVGAAELAAMRPTAVLVNTARGEVVDELALADALRERRILGAGLDVFSTEPLPPDHPLLSLPNVVLTPHVGGVTADSATRLIRHAMGNFVRVAEGAPLDPADLVAAPPAS